MRLRDHCPLSQAGPHHARPRPLRQDSRWPPRCRPGAHPKRLTGADPSPDLVWWLEDPVREAVRPGQPLALPMRLDEDGFEQLGLVHSLSRPLLIGPETTVVEASSGSTAVSEAYFARLIGCRSSR